MAQLPRLSEVDRVDSPLPEPPARQVPLGATAARRHVVRAGDTLPALARTYLGRSDRYLDIYDYNRDVLASPDLLPLGVELKIPPVWSRNR